MTSIMFLHFILLHATITGCLAATHQGSATLINRAHIRPGFELHRLNLHVYNSVYDQLVEITIREEGFRIKLPSDDYTEPKYAKHFSGYDKPFLHTSSKVMTPAVDQTLTSLPFTSPNISNYKAYSNHTRRLNSRMIRSPKPEPSFLHDWFNIEKQTDGDLLRLKMDFTQDKIENAQIVAKESRDQIFAIRKSLRKMDSGLLEELNSIDTN